MLELQIISKSAYNEYILESNGKRYYVALSFYNMQSPEIGDLLYFPENYLDTKSKDYVHSLFFEPLQDGEEAETRENDLAGLRTRKEEFVLKRIYG